MKFTKDWLSDHLSTSKSEKQIIEKLNGIGLEVEKVDHVKNELSEFVVAKIIKANKHPNADKLNLTKIDIGQGEALQIVCGAPNVVVGQKVPVATIGTVLYNENSEVKISGWVHRKRDHGSLLFVDLRDHFGLTQCVVDSSDKVFTLVESLRNESVVTITGVVKKRSKETINKNLKTGQIEVSIEDITIQSEADILPLQVNSDEDAGEETRLRYRYLDLRREPVKQNIILRSEVAFYTRNFLKKEGFLEKKLSICHV